MLKIGSLWQHYKTKNIYRVLSLSMREEDLEALVTYECTEKRLVFTCPLRRFLGKLDGKDTKYRFEFIEVK